MASFLWRHIQSKSLFLSICEKIKALWFYFQSKFVQNFVTPPVSCGVSIRKRDLCSWAFCSWSLEKNSTGECPILCIEAQFAVGTMRKHQSFTLLAWWVTSHRASNAESVPCKVILVLWITHKTSSKWNKPICQFALCGILPRISSLSIYIYSQGHGKRANSGLGRMV